MDYWVPLNLLNSPVAQLAKIEAYLYDILNDVAKAAKAAPERVAALHQAVRVARRNEFRQQQLEAERQRQEERNQRILQRAQEPPPRRKVNLES